MYTVSLTILVVSTNWLTMRNISGSKHWKTMCDSILRSRYQLGQDRHDIMIGVLVVYLRTFVIINNSSMKKFLVGWVEKIFGWLFYHIEWVMSWPLWWNFTPDADCYWASQQDLLPYRCQWHVSINFWSQMEVHTLKQGCNPHGHLMAEIVAWQWIWQSSTTLKQHNPGNSQSFEFVPWCFDCTHKYSLGGDLTKR